MFTRRLSTQIYLTIVASLLAVVLLSGLVWNLFGERFDRNVFDAAGRLLQLSLPAADAPAAAQSEAVEKLGRELNVDISLFDQRRRLIATSARPAPPSSRLKQRSGWRRVGKGRGWSLQLHDGRWVVIDLNEGDRNHSLLNLALLIGSVVVGVGLASYPFARRLTRRLERLQKGVDQAGSGDLSARVKIEGRDEVADLAMSFNLAAQKIEELVDAHRLLLANASHELRTPLARIRLGVEMLKNKDDPVRRSALEEDIGELDSLIDGILVMSRLGAGFPIDLSQSIDLLALAAEECARYDHCSIGGSAPDITGDPQLLRRLIRNLLENSRRHGRPPIEVHVTSASNAVTLTVRDHGDGISQSDRQKIFQPFFRSADRQNVDGYGLGLPLVRQIAESHGGSVYLPPQMGNGFTVEVTLPARLI